MVVVACISWPLQQIQKSLNAIESDWGFSYLGFKLLGAEFKHLLKRAVIYLWVVKTYSRHLAWLHLACKRRETKYASLLSWSQNYPLLRNERQHQS